MKWFEGTPDHFVSWSHVHAHDLQSNRMSRFYCAQTVPGRYHAIVRNRGKQTTTAKPTILVHAGRHHQIPADQRERGRRWAPWMIVSTMWESFFATLECELLNRRRFKTQVEARMAVFDFIEGQYNSHRRHSALDYPSPINYERSHPAETGFRGHTVYRNGGGQIVLGVSFIQEIGENGMAKTK